MYLNVQYRPAESSPWGKSPRGAAGRSFQVKDAQRKPRVPRAAELPGSGKAAGPRLEADPRRGFPSQSQACQRQQETRGLGDKCCGLSAALSAQWLPGDSAIKVPFKPGRVRSRGCVSGQHFPLLFQPVDTYKFSRDSGTGHASAAAASKGSLKAAQDTEKSILWSNYQG